MSNPKYDRDIQLKQIFAPYSGKHEELISILQQIQKEFGYLSDTAMLAAAKFTRTPPSSVYSVATFYSQFRFSPIGRYHIMACRGTACHVKGAPKLLEELISQLKIDDGEVTQDGIFSLETVACIGACGLAPAMVINGKTYGRLTPKRVVEILDELRESK
jgi:NADH:ubiquinone oxidoreductase subunit E